ncbi:unnamed protein product [Orchesella dallaii]|uniref:Double-strand break repair protein n=1 Tax=Orchesella dallaii TaxID=48710 RepID=A0ABP1QH14_9HEXA
MDASFDDDGIPIQTGEVVPSTGEVADEHTFKILVATDNHLGYCDNNPARESDSFDTFEEILKLAVDNDVDFVLLGGDLFHENKPRPNVLRKTTELLQKYCLGSKPVSFQYVGNPERDFPNADEPEVNYYNPNINIALPVFTIHGNHDDPIGHTKTSAVDHLAAAKLVNHFGQWDNLNNIEVSPVLLTKGETKLALYGLGHLKDDRLNRLMHDKKITFIGPEEDRKAWFNLFVLHQNRVKHGPKNYIPENYVPGYMDLVVWGHEHECRIHQELAEGLVNTYICQPGSSVATSLCHGEAVEKHVALLKINRRMFRIEKLKLQTVRPFVMRDITAKEILERCPKNAGPKERSRHMEKYMENLVTSLIQDADDLLTGHPKQPTIPLVRVRVFHDDVEDTFNPIRFSQKFVDKVANDDIIMFKKTPVKREDGAEIDAHEIGVLMMQHDEDDLEGHVETIVENYFTQARNKGETNSLLEVLSERGLSEAVKSAVDKEDYQAISVVVESQIEKVIEYLIKKNVTEDSVEDELEEFRQRRNNMSDQEKKEVDEMLSQRKPKKTKPSNGGSDGEESFENGNNEDGDSPIEVLDDEDDAPSTSRSRGARGASRARGATRGRGRGRGKNAASDDTSPPAPSSRGRGRASASGSRSKNAKETSSRGKSLVQTTLTARRSPRKASQAMVFDDSD